MAALALSDEASAWLYLAVVIVLPFFSFAVALLVPRASSRATLHRSLLFISVVTLTPGLMLGVMLAVQDHQDAVKFCLSFGLLFLAALAGLWRPYTWRDVLVRCGLACEWCERIGARLRFSHVAATTVAVALVVMWFLPTPMAYRCGEMGTIRHQFQVWLRDSNDGSPPYRTRLGGISVYLGLRDPVCPG